jgi:NAD(P)-dependent dehydrogenase (short-subunit alcohol dehydrogenase family)
MSCVGAMNQLTRSLAVEWASDKIRVNCVAPGIVFTDMAKQVRIQRHPCIQALFFVKHINCIHSENTRILIIFFKHFFRFEFNRL